MVIFEKEYTQLCTCSHSQWFKENPDSIKGYKFIPITQSTCQAPESASFHLNDAVMQVQEWALHDRRGRKRASYK